MYHCWSLHFVAANSRVRAWSFKLDSVRAAEELHRCAVEVHAVTVFKRCHRIELIAPSLEYNRYLLAFHNAIHWFGNGYTIANGQIGNHRPHRQGMLSNWQVHGHCCTGVLHWNHISTAAGEFESRERCSDRSI